MKHLSSSIVLGSFLALPVLSKPLDLSGRLSDVSNQQLYVLATVNYSASTRDVVYFALTDSESSATQVTVGKFHEIWY
jgi:hypothetical protein